MQGYAYDAKIRAARMARLFWDDPEFADQLEREAAALKERFNRDWWVADGEYYALALDPEGRQCDTLSSNIGHLLWSGIVEPERAEKVAQHLVGPRLFSGWGCGRSPRGGPVQPDRLPQRDDLAVRQLLHRLGPAPVRLRGGGRDHRQRHPGRRHLLRRPTARGVRRLPAGADEVPGGVPDGVQPAGVVDRYAATAAAHHARSGAARGHLAVEPRLPIGMGRIEVLDIPGRWGRVDAFARGRIDLENLSD
ncbi:hypothetical protein GCM10027614_33740 [Micromonospora vulcania]